MQGRKTAPVVAALISGLAAVVSAAPALAQEPPVVVYGETLNARTERVAFADLNLASASEQSRLHNRVGGAIERDELMAVTHQTLSHVAAHAAQSDHRELHCSSG